MAVLAVLDAHWRAPCPPFASPTKYRKEATVTLSTVLAVLAVSVVTATPLKLNPPLFRHPDTPSPLRSGTF